LNVLIEIAHPDGCDCVRPVERFIPGIARVIDDLIIALENMPTFATPA